MISVLKDDNDLVYAYVEWQILNGKGQFYNDGDYIYIQNQWISKKYRNSDAFRELVHLIYIHPYSQKATKVYWTISRDFCGYKILESEERIFESIRSSKIYEKEYIYKKITGERYAQV